MIGTDTSPFLDRLLSWSLRRPVPVVSRYLIATGLVLAVGLLRALLISSIVPWLLFIPVTMATGLLFGRAPGLYAAFLSAIVAGLSIGHVAQPLWLTGQQWAGSAMFVLVASGIGLLAAEMRAMFARAQRLVAEREAAHSLLVEREAFLASVLASSTDCIKVLDLDARLTFMSEGRQRVMEVSDFNAIVGCPWPDFWQDQGNVEARAAIAAARKGESRSFVGRAMTMAGNARWWNVAVSPVLGPDDKPVSILSVSRDITAGRENEQARDQLARIVENSADFIGMARIDGSVFFLNDAALGLVGLDRVMLGSVTIADFFPPEEAEIIRDAVLPAVERDGVWSGERLFRHFRTGELIPVLYTVFPVLDAEGAVIGHGTVTRDIRERKQAEEQQHLLNNELSHRLKNVLTVVQSIASQTLRQSESLEAADGALGARLAALAQATDILTATSWISADLAEVVRSTLAPHGFDDRVTITGPTIILHPQVTMALALAIHELATNATKYGALSNATGKIDLSWSVTGGPNAPEPRFRLRWQESGGPDVHPPTRRGFGSKMIERSLRAYFRGPAQLEYLPSGLVFTLDAPLGDAGKVVR